MLRNVTNLLESIQKVIAGETAEALEVLGGHLELSIEPMDSVRLASNWECPDKTDGCTSTHCEKCPNGFDLIIVTRHSSGQLHCRHRWPVMQLVNGDNVTLDQDSAAFVALMRSINAYINGEGFIELPPEPKPLEPGVKTLSDLIWSQQRPPRAGGSFGARDR